MNSETIKKLVELFKLLYGKSKIAAIVILFVEIAAIVAVYVLLTGCTSNIFVQRQNTGSSISSETAPSVVTRVDSTEISIPK